MKSLPLFAVLLLPTAVGASDITVPQPPPGGLFALREMDMHIHAGLERELDLQPWIDLSVADGRKVLLLLDHIELYRMSGKEYTAWAKEHGGRQWYPMKTEGHRALMADFDKAAARNDVLIFKGWEVGEFELDEGLEEAPMALAEVIGWHISPNHKGDPPDGKKLLKRIAQIKEVRKRFPVPMIIFHPFTMRIEHVQRDAQKSGRDQKTISVQEYRFFKGDEQEKVIRELRDSSIYVEMSSASAAYWEDPIVREALMADIKLLAEGGVQFTVSTDAHGAAALKAPFDPGKYCAPCAITSRNTNTIIRELLELRAKRVSPDGPTKVKIGQPNVVRQD